MFDAKVVDALKRSVVHYPNGTILLLADGRRGVVTEQNNNHSASPILRIFEEGNQLLETTYILNLSEAPNAAIEKVDTEYILEVE